MPQSHTILIPEDDPYLREAYLRRFARTPFEIRTARDGEEAARLIREHSSDLLICDIMMPKKDGWWVLEQFPRAARTFPVVMLTNLEDEETRRQCAAHGVDAFLVKKDMSLHTLVETVGQLLRRP